MSNIKTGDTLPLPHKNPAMFDFLRRRRSNLAITLSAPGPNEAELEQILTLGARVPDHRKLAPWRFLLFEDEARAQIGGHLKTAFASENPQASASRLEQEAKLFERAPLVIGVISSPVQDKKNTPEWEQILSAGAVCYNLCLAAQSLGYGAQWLTQWYSYSHKLSGVWGLGPRERIAGFIYIGRTDTPPKERQRPVLAEKTITWREPK